MTVRTIIATVFADVAKEQQRHLVPLRDDLKLLDSGLDSLSLAVIAARLEEALGCNPFDTADRFPVTFGDFVRLYQSHSKLS